ncbi:MAG: hypothetical protein Q8M18_02950 [Bradyrhizobium sp.]|nr:hypothetical protein [Bradyrhizobium sp.]
MAIVTERWDRSCGGRNGIVRGTGLQGGINSVSDPKTRKTIGVETYGKIVWT